jgi:hypothetical protein
MYSNDCLTYLLERNVDIVESVHKIKDQPKIIIIIIIIIYVVYVLDRQMYVGAFVCDSWVKIVKWETKVQSPAAICMIGRSHARRIIRAETNDDVPSPFTTPVLITPDEPPRPNRPPPTLLPPPLILPTAIDGLVAPPPPPPPTETRRGTAMPETLVRDVGGRRPEGRRKPAPVDLDGACVCATVCLLRWGWDGARTDVAAVRGAATPTTLVGTGGRCTPRSSMLRRGGDCCGGAGTERTAGVAPAAWEDNVILPAALRPGIGAATAAGAGAGAISGLVAFLVIRNVAVEAEAGMGRPEIEARAPRLGKSAGGTLEGTDAEGTWVLLPGRMNWRTGACGAARGKEIIRGCIVHGTKQALTKEIAGLGRRRCRDAVSSVFVFALLNSILLDLHIS